MATPPASPGSDDGFVTGIGRDAPAYGSSGNNDGAFDDVFAAMAGAWPGGGAGASGKEAKSAGASKQSAAAAGDAKKPHAPKPKKPSVADIAAALTARDEALMQGKAPPLDPLLGEPAAKRVCFAAPAEQELPFILVKPVTERAIKVRAADKGERRKTPDRVADAFATLNLPLTATEADVARKVRQMSRLAHPDKVAAGDRGRSSSIAFQNLQAAKNLVISWLRHGRIPTNGDDSDIGSGDESGSDEFGEDLGRLNEDGDVVEQGNDQGGSESEEGHEADISARKHDPEDGSGSEGGDDGTSLPNQSLVFASQEGIRGNLSVLAQATMWSRHLQSNDRKRMCQECLEREVAPGKEVCKPCQKQEAKLMGQISRPNKLGMARRAR